MHVNTPATGQQQTSNKQATTNKNDKNEKKEKNDKKIEEYRNFKNKFLKDKAMPQPTYEEILEYR